MIGVHRCIGMHYLVFLAGNVLSTCAPRREACECTSVELLHKELMLG